MNTAVMGRIVQLMPKIDLVLEDPIYLATDKVGIVKICFSYTKAICHAGLSGKTRLVTKKQLEAMLFEKIDLKLVH